MKEQSHKEEMSAAIRGDFQRLRDRGVSASLALQDAPEPEPDASPNGGGATPHEEQAPEPSAEDPVEAMPRRGWLSRLAGR